MEIRPAVRIHRSPAGAPARQPVKRAASWRPGRGTRSSRRSGRPGRASAPGSRAAAPTRPSRPSRRRRTRAGRWPRAGTMRQRALLQRARARGSARMAAWPRYQVGRGGIASDRVVGRASRRSRRRRRTPTRRRSARRSRAPRRRRARAASPAGCARAAARRPPCARAAGRCRSTAGVASSVSATSAGEKPSTSRRSSTARWRGGQVLERGDEGELDALALLVAGLGAGEAVVSRALVGYGSIQTDSTSGARARRADRRPARSRAAAPAAAGARSAAGSRWWRSGTARSAASCAPRSAASPRQARSSVSCSASSASWHRAEHPVAVRVQLARGAARRAGRRRPRRPRARRRAWSSSAATFIGTLAVWAARGRLAALGARPPRFATRPAPRAAREDGGAELRRALGGVGQASTSTYGTQTGRGVRHSTMPPPTSPPRARAK